MTLLCFDTGGMRTFTSDLQIGEQAQVFVVQVHVDIGWTHIKSAEGYFPDWDESMMSPEGDIYTFEIKWDLLAHKTGNFFFEFEALTHSKADKLVYCYGQPISKLYIYDLPTLKIYLLGREPNSRGSEGYIGWCYPIETFNPKVYELPIVQ